MGLAHEREASTVWRPLGELGSAALEPQLRALIAVAGSLTHSLRERCAGNFRLRLLGERRAQQHAARVREVLMLCADTHWVFAQTVIPDATRAANPWLDELGDRPLGDTLFERPGVERREMHFGELPAGERLFQRALACAGLDDVPGALWARRSVICIGANELFVNEVFLPGAGGCRTR